MQNSHHMAMAAAHKSFFSFTPKDLYMKFPCSNSIFIIKYSKISSTGNKTMYNPANLMQKYVTVITSHAVANFNNIQGKDMISHL